MRVHAKSSVYDTSKSIWNISETHFPRANVLSYAPAAKSKLQIQIGTAGYPWRDHLRKTLVKG